MDCQICNCTRRPVAIHCNSGTTHHLSPGCTFELPQQELFQNASIKRLQDRKIISILALKTKSTSTESSKDTKTETVKEDVGKKPEKSSKKKSQTK